MYTGPVNRGDLVRWMSAKYHVYLTGSVVDIVGRDLLVVVTEGPENAMKYINRRLPMAVHRGEVSELVVSTVLTEVADEGDVPQKTRGKSVKL